MHPDKKAFLAAIRANRFDMLYRKIYADWLDEHGDHDEANVQRAWTVEKERSVEWLEGCADTCGLAYRKLIAAAELYAEENEYTYMGQNEDYKNAWEDFREDGEFWKHYEIVTGKVIVAERRGSFFSCSC